MTELVRINTLITKPAYERLRDEIERRNGEMALKATLGNIIVRMAMKDLPKSNWEEREEMSPGGSPRKPPRGSTDAKAARRRPVKAKSATRAPAEKAQAAGGS